MGGVACNDEPIQNSVRKMIRPQLINTMSILMHYEEIKSDIVAMTILDGIIENKSTIKDAINYNPLLTNIGKTEKCEDKMTLCKIFKTFEILESKISLDMVTLNNFTTTSKDTNLNKVTCSVEVGLKNMQKTIPESNSTSEPRIITADYEAQLSDNKKQVKIEIKKINSI
ncbi:MAG: hypothetical protein Q4D84_00725 [Campylobacter sp.]|nr:hypothetical protein [Campylobacter sp.]